LPALPDDWTLPAVDDRNREWFESGSLAVQTCASCGAHQHPPEEICHRCGSMDFTSIGLSPTGVVHSFTVVHYAVHRALAAALPYVVVIVALDDDPSIRVVGNLLDVDPATVEIGLPVHAVWEARSDEHGDVLLPQWRPA